MKLDKERLARALYCILEDIPVGEKNEAHLDALFGSEPDYAHIGQTHRDYLDKLLSFIASTGFRIVPEEPTEAMIEAMKDAWRETYPSGISGMTIDAQWRNQNARWLAAWSAMLHASEGDGE